MLMIATDTDLCHSFDDGAEVGKRRKREQTEYIRESVLPCLLLTTTNTDLQSSCRDSARCGPKRGGGAGKV